jgi:hypothetical protein
MDRYPVDGIKDKIPCELHQSMKNISMKVAFSYARVGVDETVPGYESLELDILGPEDEATLGEVKDGVILWYKKDIKFPGLAPPPPSRRRSPSPSSPPRDYDDHHSMSPYRSPLSGQPSSPYRLCPLSLRAKSRSVPPQVLNTQEPTGAPPKSTAVSSQEYRCLLPRDLTTILWR